MYKEDFSDVEWQWVKCAKCLKKRKVPGFVSANAYTWSCVNNIHDPLRLVYLEKFLLKVNVNSLMNPIAIAVAIQKREIQAMMRMIETTTQIVQLVHRLILFLSVQIRKAKVNTEWILKHCVAIQCINFFPGMYSQHFDPKYIPDKFFSDEIFNENASDYGGRSGNMIALLH